MSGKIVKPNLEEFLLSAGIETGKLYHRILETVYYEEKTDSRVVILHFNGAADFTKYKPPFFQRWSWFDEVPHTRFHIHDHVITEKNKVRMGWYIGHQKGSLSETILELIIDACRRKYGNDVVFLAVGSSIGGFAAIRSVLLGYTDYALAVNPQTDIYKYNPRFVKDLVDKCFGGNMNHPNLKQRASLIDKVSLLPTNAKCVVYQNYYDQFHYENHFLPLVEAVGELPANWKNWDLRLYVNKGQGHSPPPRPTFIAWVEELLLRIYKKEESSNLLE